MSKFAVAAALKAIPGARPTMAPQSSGMGRISPVHATALFQNPYRDTYGPFLPRPSETFTDGAFGPMSPIQPVPVDEPPPGGQYPDPRYWPYKVGWNLPTPPGTEGLKLASFDQLRVLSQRYSVARACIDLRQQEIRGLHWEITLTKNAAKAYQNSNSKMRDFGERAAQATRFFKRPDPGYWNFDSFLQAMLEEIFVYDALALIFRPKYGARAGMGGRGLFGSDLDSIRLVSGPTIRPLVDMHGDPPAPPAPAYQQYLYGVPRSDYLTIMRGTDIDDSGLAGAEVNSFSSDIMLYAPYWLSRETPYGFPPVERALLPIISGLQKQEFQLDYFTEGTTPAVYISPGDPNITPTQIKELQDALNGIAGDPAYHMKVIVLPPGSKVEPQRPVDLADGFDQLVMTQVCMAFDVQPMEIGVLPDIGGQSQQGPSASAVRFAAQEARDIKSRKSTKPLLKWICDIFDYVLQDICGQTDLRFQFEGLSDDEDKQAITELGVQQVQNGISSIDEVRDRLDMPPWGLQETSEPVVFTAQGPIPFSMAPQLIMAAQQNAQGGSRGGGSAGGNNRTQSTNSGQRTAKQPAVRAGGQTKPNGSHPAPLSPHRESVTPGHAAAQGAIQSPTPRTGGTPSRSSVAGSRKKAAEAELDALRRHLRKGRLVTSWEARHLPERALSMIAEDLAKGVLIDIAVERASVLVKEPLEPIPAEPVDQTALDLLPKREWQYRMVTPAPLEKAIEWPGWEHDLGLVGAYKQLVGKAFKSAQTQSDELRDKAARGDMFVSGNVLNGLISDQVHGTFMEVLEPLWTEAWHLGYEGGKALAKGTVADFTNTHNGEGLQNFINSQGEHWLQQISRTGLKDIESRPEMIARTEVARAMNAGAFQAYKTSGIPYKQLAIAPDDSCDICKTAEGEGIIPMDSIFPSGDLYGPFHPNCRCVPVPAWTDVIPPQSHIGKHENDDPSMVAFILFRAGRGDDAQFLLQKRGEDVNNPGCWGLPGGTSTKGEDPWDTAYRESCEEMGTLPECTPAGCFTEDEDERSIYIFLCDVPESFSPDMNGATPQETAGWGWFTRKEIKHLDLQPNFGRQWDKLKHQVTKSLQRMVNENGEELFLTDAGAQLQAVGSRWPYPHRADGTEEPEPHYNQAPGEMGASEPPGWRDMSDVTGQTRIYPRGDQDDKYPRRRKPNKPASRFPDQGGQRYPTTSNGGPQSPGSSIPGKAAPVPAVGSVPAVAPKPGSPRSVPPEVYDPAESVATEDENGNIAYYPQPKKKGAGGPSDYSDPNPVDVEHVLNLMRSNFPEDAIQWVKRARWVGPVQIPWERIDIDDIENWAASHQMDAVNRFARDIKAGTGHTNPSILIQDNDSPKAIIIDGHHRALAHHKLGQPVLAYLGMIDPRDRMAAEETHSKQVHSGNDPRNK